MRKCTCDPLEVEKLYIQCECSSDEHLVKLSRWKNDSGDPDDDWVSLTVHLHAWEGFFRRIWVAIKFVFGYRCRYGEWDEVVISPSDFDKFIQFFEAAKKDHEKTTYHCSKMGKD